MGGAITIRWLLIVPFIGLLGGVPFVNRVTPLVLGLPMLLAWVAAWSILTSAIVALVYAFDPANRDDSETGSPGQP